jgi:tetratricopeptide (TPR) repeat protein
VAFNNYNAIIAAFFLFLIVPMHRAMKSVLLFSTLLFVLSSFRISAQSEEELQDYFNEGQYFFNRKEYQDAVFYYLKLVDADSSNANYNFKVGESYLNIPGKEHLAIPYFERSLNKLVSKQAYKKRSFEENAAPLHAYFYLGNAYRMNNQLNEALECYMKFIDSPHFHNNYNLNVVDKEIKSCERAKIIQDAPIEFEKVNLGSNINTSFAEERPVISADGKTLVFIRRLQFYDAIFFTTQQDGEWDKAININPQILSDGDFYPTGLSSDGTEMLLVRKEGDSYDIYQSSFDGTVWSKAVKMSDKLNTIYPETYASFGPGDRSILITSGRKGGKGGLDIWKAVINEDGTWGKPKNLGKQINTELDEQNACVSSDKEVLFFSSQGHYTMGGYDIFYTRKIGKKWRIPINIGYPINNTRDNLFYCPSHHSCREAYLSLVEENGFGASDIYFIRISSESTLLFEDSPGEN